MKLALILPVLAVAACSSTGVGFVQPDKMSPADACYNAQLVLTAMAINDVQTLAPTTYERAVLNVDFLCGMAPQP